MADTRWADSPAERARFGMSSTTLARALFDPPDPAAVDYIVMPVSVAAAGQAFPEVVRHAERVNAWLARAPAGLISGDRTMTLGDVLTHDPGVRVVRNDAAFVASWRPETPAGIVFGAAFDTILPSARGQPLSGSGVALRPGVPVVAPLRLTTHTTLLALRAKGTAAARQDVSPVVGFDIAASTDTAFRASFAHVDFHLERSQGGMQEYELRMHRTLPPGDYAVRLRPDDMDGLLVLVDWLRVAEGP